MNTHFYNATITGLSRPILYCALVFITLFLFLYFPSDTAYARGHDFLDSVYLFYVIRARVEEFFFDFNYVVPQLINGLPFNALALSDFGIGQNLYLLLPPFDAYVANEFLRRSLALGGMYLLLRDYVAPSNDFGRFVSALVALSFAALPDQANRFGTITMLPLIVWAGTNIWNGQYRWWNWLPLLFYPFYSFLVLGGFVVCGYLLIVMIYAFAKQHTNRWVIAAIFAYFIAAYVLVEIRMFYHWFFSDYVSSRGALPQVHYEPSVFFREFSIAFLQGRHANHVTGHTPLVLPLVALAALVAATGIWKQRSSTFAGTIWKTTPVHIFFLTLGLVFVNSVVYGMDQGGFFAFKYALDFPFSFHRVDVSNPVLWRVLFALSIIIVASRLSDRRQWVARLVLVLITAHSVLQLPGLKGELNRALGIPAHVGLRAAALGLDPGPPDRSRPGQTRLGEYFHVESFEAMMPVIQSKLNLPLSRYRVASIGLRPSVAQYHGYYTLDGRFWDSPIDYSDKFYPISKEELAKDGADYPRGLGYYVYFSEQSRRGKAIDIAFDTCVFVALGGRVVFSLWPIATPEHLQWERLGRFGEVYVYSTSDDISCPKKAASKA